MNNKYSIFLSHNLNDFTSSEDSTKLLWLGRGELIESPTQIQDKVLNELDRAHDGRQLNPLLKPTSERAYNAAKRWITWARNKFIELSTPYVIVTGDGGVIIEWRMSGNFVSVHFDETDDEMDTVFYKISNKQDTEDFNEKSFEELLSGLTAYDVISAPEIAEKSLETSRTSRGSYARRIRYDFIRTISATNHSGQKLGC